MTLFVFLVGAFVGAVVAWEFINKPEWVTKMVDHIPGISSFRK